MQATKQESSPCWVCAPASARRRKSSKVYSTEAASVYRIRFFNYNMGISPCSSIDVIRGPNALGFEALFSEPFADGSAVDIVACAFEETSLPVQTWADDYMRRRAGSLDKIICQDAHESGSQRTGWLFGLASAISAYSFGNLVSAIAFSSKRFAEDTAASVFGRLPEAEARLMGVAVAGANVPNPKKAFIGRSIRQRCDDIRLCFAASHFPLSQIKTIYEDGAQFALESGKAAVARSLRKVLQRAASRGILDDSTIFFLQGDLNSRTLIVGGALRDLLADVLADATLQAAIRHDLNVPVGQWCEAIPTTSASRLPVTYKFREDVGEFFAGASEAKETTVTLGDMFSSGGGADHEHSSNIYRQALKDVGTKTRDGWGILFNEEDFKAFHFPACADRVIYWAPTRLNERMHWEFPKGGYEVDHAQPGSDHRPVMLEAVLRIAPAVANVALKQKPTLAVKPTPELLDAICQDDHAFSDDN